MKSKCLYLLILSILLFVMGCWTAKPTFKADNYITGTYTKFDTVTLFDSLRNRAIPIATYEVVNKEFLNTQRKLVILNPGYGGKNTDYGFIARHLASNGYFVVVIQHDNATDDSLPKTGDIYKSRKPFWDRGVQNVFFVTNKLKQKYFKLDYKHIILIGHSNGGDIAMLIANEYPDFARVVITLDNRRVPFPRVYHPKIFSLRSSDQPADAGVIPSGDEQKKYKIKVIRVNIKHNDMGGMGTETELNEINNYIMNFLRPDS